MKKSWAKPEILLIALESTLKGGGGGDCLGQDPSG